jgi:hypothetical protein
VDLFKSDGTPSDAMQAAHDQMVADFTAAHAAAVVEYEPVIEDGVVHTRRVQEIDPVLDFAKHMAENHTKPHYGEAAVRYVGTIPQVLADTWAREAGVAIGTREFLEVAKRKLMDSDYAYLRVRGF